ncbi:MAG: sugar transferase [Actinomycetota bacterium]
MKQKRGSRGRLIRRALVAADILGLGLAFAVSILIFGSHSTRTDSFAAISELGLFAATLPGWLILAKLQGLYDHDVKHAGHTTVDDVIPVVTLITIGSWLLYGGSALTGFAEPYPPKLFTFWLLANTFVVTARVAARAFCRRRKSYLQNMVVVGAGETGLLLARKLEDHPEYGVHLLGFVEVHADANDEGRAGLLGSVEELPQIVREHAVERILIAFPNVSREETMDLVAQVRDLELQVDIVPRFVDLVTPSATIHTIEGLPLISLSTVRADRLSLALKRVVDIVGSLTALVLLAPALAWIAVRIKLDSPGPVFYRHERVGLYGRSFRLLKFRTMNLASSAGAAYGGDAAAAELSLLLEDPVVRAEFAQNHKLANDPRVTKFGRFLRRLSLDELPQLANVLLGDMSLVGPRPVTRDELVRYGDETETLLSFRPGVTGYWQINGRSRTHYGDRVRLDLAYVRGWSLKLDFLILGKTAWVLLTGHGAY